MLASNVSLGALRLQAQDRADLENSAAISTAAWNQYISQSYKRLYDMLVSAYGDDYYIANLFQFNLGGGTQSSQYYPLPDGTIPTLNSTTPAPALYKLLNVDLLYTAAPSGFVTIKRFEEIDRNKYAWPNTAINFLGYTNLKYRISGTNIEFIPAPMAGQTIQLKYIPKPTSLQFLPTCGITLNSAVISTTDTTDLQVGMSVYGPGIQIGTTVLSLTSNTVTMSLPALSTAPVLAIAFWIDSVIIDGVSGWEEYIIIDAAIKARVKQEQSVDDLRVQKEEMVNDIQIMSQGRDVGQAQHTSDVLGANGYGYDGFGDGGGGIGGRGGM